VQRFLNTPSLIRIGFSAAKPKTMPLANQHARTVAMTCAAIAC
jgi:hypothetical protein